MARVLLALGLLLGSPAIDAPSTPPPLTLQITPAHQFEPGTVHYRITIAPHRDNFWFCMGWDNQTTLRGRTSCQQLNGIYGPRVFYQDYTKLAPGAYHGFVQLYRTPNYLAHTAVHAFKVIPLFAR